MNWQHGGDVRSYEIAYGQRPLDFSANGSPLGMPALVRQAVMASLERGAEYPDPWCRSLRQALGGHLGVPVSWILCGSGASDLLYRLVAAVRPARALVTAPTFSAYVAALQMYGCAVEQYPLTDENDYDLTPGILGRITPAMDMVILCQPGNPTGRTIPRELLLQILARCQEMGTLLVVDECFLDFLEEREILTMQGALAGRPLVILRAFTKFYGMAGLRLGYCLSADGDLLARMQQAGPPWAVSSVAQAAGVAALEETAYADHLRELIREQRPVLLAGLRDLGCRVIPGAANYLLFYVADTMLEEKMQQQGIMMRDCRNYDHLGPGWYRVAVRTEVENAQLLAALQEVMAR